MLGIESGVLGRGSSETKIGIIELKRKGKAFLLFSSGVYGLIIDRSIATL